MEPIHCLLVFVIFEIIDCFSSFISLNPSGMTWLRFCVQAIFAWKETCKFFLHHFLFYWEWSAPISGTQTNYYLFWSNLTIDHRFMSLYWYLHKFYLLDRRIYCFIHIWNALSNTITSSFMEIKPFFSFCSNINDV